MKLTTKQLRQIIKEELNEMQTHLGLPHVFTGYDLAGKLYEFADMADPTQPNKQAEQIRQMALNRLVKLRHRLSSEMEGSVEAENLFQEIGMLEEAIDYYDTSMEDWNPNREYKVKPNEPNPNIIQLINQDKLECYQKTAPIRQQTMEYFIKTI